MPHAPPQRPAFCIALALLLALGAPAAADEENLLKNGALTAWADGRPEHWDVSIGARNRDGPSSALKRPAGGGLQLSGDASTGTWQYVSQPVGLRAGDHARLDVEAQARVRLEPGQFRNCYVGLVYRDAAQKRLGMHVHEVRPGVPVAPLFVRVPDAAAYVEVAIFLSMTGRLEVRSIALTRLAPESSYDVLVDDMDRHYSFFAAHGIDWKRLADAHRERAEQASGPAAFAKAVRPLLAALEDPHVFIELPGGERIPTVTKAVTPNVDYPVTARSLRDVVQIGRTAFAGRTKRGGYGFLAVASLQQSDAEFERIVAAWLGLFDAPGLILDLRGNIGGAEVRAQRLASYLARERRDYAHARVRDGPAHDALRSGGTRHVEPHAKTHYVGPVACLIGPVCMSSGEGFALMMKALPDVVLLGLPTRGASGNPQPVHLPNGVTVHYSRWISLMPDGTPIERRGVPPDITVKQEGAGDPTLDAAIAELERRLKDR